jgi:hypothetical protein
MHNAYMHKISIKNGATSNRWCMPLRAEQSMVYMPLRAETLSIVATTREPEPEPNKIVRLRLRAKRFGYI